MYQSFLVPEMFHVISMLYKFLVSNDETFMTCFSVVFNKIVLLKNRFMQSLLTWCSHVEDDLSLSFIWKTPLSFP